MKLLKTKKPDPVAAEAVILPVFKSRNLEPVSAQYPGLDALIKRCKFKCAAGESIVYHQEGRLIFLLGAGAADRGKLIDVIKTVNKLVPVLKQYHIGKAVLQFLQATLLSESFFKGLFDHLFMSEYRFDKYNRDEKNAPVDIDSLYFYFHCPESAVGFSTDLIEQRRVIAESSHRTRHLVNEPAQYAHPDHMVAAFENAAAADAALTIEVLRRDQLEKEGYNGLLTVGRASRYQPALVRLSYHPPQAFKTIAVVGKGITFDTGGLNIKTGSSMYDMKCDMSGAAAVLGIMESLAALNLPLVVQGYAAIAENAVGESAFKPGDIISYKNNKTVEVVNTDAEGRLVLADALLKAVEDKPHYIVELSTLTGSVVSALGSCYAGIMGNHKKLLNLLQKAGDNVGERLWPLPLPEEYRENIKSRIAHLKNAGYGRVHTISAGLFLEQFTGRVPFAHIDIAGTAFINKPNTYFKLSGATAFGVRLVLEFLELLARQTELK